MNGAPLTRRSLLGRATALAAGTLAISPLAAVASAGGKNDKLEVEPRFYPRSPFRPDVELAGKLAVVTGASRGNGRAIAEALAAHGVDVIGTSRNPAGVPNPPAFPLLALDVADPASVLAFAGALQAHPRFQSHGRLDILVNNAGRFVLGQIVPLPPTSLGFYLSQRDLAVRTLYTGHVMTTSVLLPLIPQQGYGRILFTVSAASYYTGSTIPGGSGLDAYNACKAALRGYADDLGSALREGGSSIRVSTVNPFVMNTALAMHPNPIYTQPVNASGLSDTDQAFNSGITYVRQLLANGLPPAMVGETAAQLLAMTDPDPNVAVGSRREPLATQGGNDLVESQVLAENTTSALPFSSK